ncbi:MAG: hypothetical protein F4X03_03330 [Dehalococcoidia bacterium]|nr:hypothetical protein [Dehalococcoidia bacterium]
MTCPRPRGRPGAIAHRAGNDLARLEHATSIGADLVELDVWLRRGRLEVRHAKTVGPLPLLRERWRLSPAWGPRLELEAVIETAGPDVQLMVDLKSETLALSEGIVAAFDRCLPAATYAVTTREWWLLEPFEGRDGVCLIPSAAWPHELAELMPTLGDRFHALSMHITLVEPALMSELSGRGVSTFVWPVNTTAELERVLGAGAAGVNSDNLDLLAQVIANGEAHPEQATPKKT